MDVDPSTSVSLLLRLQSPNNPQSKQDWDRFVAIYTPLLFMWSRNRRLQEADVADLVQTTFVKVFAALPRRQFDPKRKFRSYLFTILLNTFRDFCTKQKRTPVGHDNLDQILAEASADNQFFEEPFFAEYTLAHAYEVMERILNPKELEICTRIFQHGEEPRVVAEQLQIPIHQVYTAKSRGIKKVRDEFRGFLH